MRHPFSRPRQAALRRALRAGALLLPFVLLAACDDPKPTQQQGFASEARALSEERLRARAKGPGASFRAVQVYPQASSGAVAVCGQMNLTGATEEAFIPFVSVVTPAAEAGATPQIEQFLAASTVEATRTYIEMLDRCRENGGPSPGGRPGAQPLPPVPGSFPSHTPAPPTPPAPQSTPPSASAPPAPGPAAATPAEGSALARQNANLRASPLGGGEVLRVVPRGTGLTIFGRAPGGWYQVGTGQPEGWVHGSMLQVQ
ncbi:SH3 domain-containing protein [Pseudoroseomonas sp. WGS1072]|uniref:SH3 domain-containing protein n=1 Tax=Roseomonas sp. WGS1072 TaxID=3366816 RepID=UPI003BEFD14D